MDEIKTKSKDEYRASRILYIIQAAVEYFIATLAGGAYLAKITTSIGIPDDVTAILTATVSLGVGFQLFALFISRNKRAKGFVIPWSLAYQLLFTLLYVLPIADWDSKTKTVILFVLLISGHVIQNVINSPKIRWLMGLVDDNKRGSFTAVKEIISLLSGMAFFNTVGYVIDKFEEAGNLTGGFITLGVAIFALTVIHTLLLIFTREKNPENKSSDKDEPILAQIKDVVCDKNLWKVLPVSILWSIASHIATPFYGTFQIKELGFQMLTVTILSAVASLSRACVSLPFGRFADKHSYTALLRICFPIAGVAFLANVFACGVIGPYCFAIYTVLHSVSLAGINGAAINLIYDAVPHERRVGAIAIRGALSGFIGFFATMAARPLVQHIQANGNSFLGMNIYAQQVLSAISVILIIVIIIYLNTVLRGFKRVYERN